MPACRHSLFGKVEDFGTSCLVQNPCYLQSRFTLYPRLTTVPGRIVASRL